MIIRKSHKKIKVAVVFMNNEILLGSLKEVLEEKGYEVRQDMDSCLDAKFAVVGAYFAYLGVIKQLKAINPSLPIIVLESSGYVLNGFSDPGEIYDVIRIQSNNQSETSHKLRDWFSKGNGKFLSEEGRT